jgi:hypothetical protein
VVLAGSFPVFARPFAVEPPRSRTVAARVWGTVWHRIASAWHNVDPLPLSLSLSLSSHTTRPLALSSTEHTLTRQCADPPASPFLPVCTSLSLSLSLSLSFSLFHQSLARLLPSNVCVCMCVCVWGGGVRGWHCHSDSRCRTQLRLSSYPLHLMHTMPHYLTTPTFPGRRPDATRLCVAPPHPLC